MTSIAGRCYYCGETASTREHVPPKSFFPRGGNLQLKTVPSCPKHNNAKSGDDQYLLAHITMHAAFGQNLAKTIFMRSIRPQLQRMPSFANSLIADSIDGGDGAVGYTVHLERFDSFFDHLSRALYFDRYRVPFNDRTHGMTHHYFSLASSNGQQQEGLDILRGHLQSTYDQFGELVTSYEADKIDDYVYQNRIIDPAGSTASITIAHTFYGVFEVASLLTRVV